MELAVDSESAYYSWLVVVAIAFCLRVFFIEEARSLAANTYANELFDYLVIVVELLELLIKQKIIDNFLKAATFLPDECSNKSIFPKMARRNVQKVCDFVPVRLDHI